MNSNSRIYENSQGIQAIKKKLEVLHNSQSRKFTSTIEELETLEEKLDSLDKKLDLIINKMNAKKRS
tara:strand:- start:494 stop:694 length:201 start_codon:yes stop_codon:yes gene_type:complete